MAAVATIGCVAGNPNAMQFPIMSKNHRDHQIVLRIAEPLREVLETEAADDGRTLSSLIRKILIQHAAHRISERAREAA